MLSCPREYFTLGQVFAVLSDRVLAVGCDVPSNARGDAGCEQSRPQVEMRRVRRMAFFGRA
jgi:hypothetical protein